MAPGTFPVLKWVQGSSFDHVLNLTNNFRPHCFYVSQQVIPDHVSNLFSKRLQLLVSVTQKHKMYAQKWIEIISTETTSLNSLESYRNCYFKTCRGSKTHLKPHFILNLYIAFLLKFETMWNGWKYFVKRKWVNYYIYIYMYMYKNLSSMPTLLTQG